MARHAVRALVVGMVVGVVSGLVLLVAARLLYAADLISIELGDPNEVIRAAITASCCVGVYLFLDYVRKDPVPPAPMLPEVGRFRLAAPHSALIQMVCDAGVPRGALVVRESLTVEIPFEDKPAGAGWVTVIELDQPDKGQAWHLFYWLTDRDTRDRDTQRLAATERLRDPAQVTRNVAAAYRSEALAGDGGVP